MDLSQYSKIGQLINTLNDTGAIFSDNIVIDQQKFLLAAPILLAHQIQQYYYESLAENSTVTVLIVNPDLCELSNNGQFYAILNTPLDIDVSWHLIFNGPNATQFQPPINVRLDPRFRPEKIRTTLDNLPISEAILKHGVPNMVILNNPIMEGNFNSLMIEDNGLCCCLMSGIPIFGSSFSNDDVLLDQYIFDAFGVTLKFEHNHLAPDFKNRVGKHVKTLSPAVQLLNEQGLLDWGTNLWHLIPEELGIYGSKLTLLSDSKTAASAIFYYLLQKGKVSSQDQVASQIHHIINGEKISRIYGPYSLNHDHLCLFDEENGKIVLSDVDYDPSQFNLDNMSSLDTMKLLGIVFQKNIKNRLSTTHNENAHDQSELPISMIKKKWSAEDMTMK